MKESCRISDNGKDEIITQRKRENYIEDKVSEG
jgi:hypothetical protein